MLDYHEAGGRCKKTAALALAIFLIFSPGFPFYAPAQDAPADEAQEVDEEKILRRLIDLSFQAEDYDKAYGYLSELKEMIGELSAEETLKWAKAAELDGNPERALEILLPLREIDEPSAEVIIETANLRTIIERHSEAAEDYRALAEMQPEEPRWTRMRGMSLFWAEDFEQAAPILETALEGAPDDDDLALRYAESLLFSGQYEAAAKAFEPLVEENPQDHGMRIQLADALMGAEEYYDAMEHLRILVESPPDMESGAARRFDYEYRLLWAKAAEMAELPERALEILQPLREMDPPSPEVVEMTASLNTITQAHSEAAEDYRLLAELQPEETKWRRMRAKSLLWAGEFAAAADLFGELRQADPADDELERLYAEALLYSQQFEKAADILESIVERTPEDHEIRGKLADALMGASEYARAKEHYRALVESPPALAPHEAAHYELEHRLKWAKAAEMTGQPARAIEILEPLRKQEPPAPEVVELTAIQKIRLRDYQGAAEEYLALIDLEPDEKYWHLMLGSTMIWAGDYEAAAIWFESVDIEHETDDIMRERYADALFFGGRNEEAIEIYSDILARREDDPALRKKLADALMGAERHEEALEHYRALYADHPEDIEIIGGLANALYLSGRLDESLAMLDEQMERDPENYEIPRLAADIEAENLAYDNAIEKYNRALELGDPRLETRIRLARVLSWNRDYDDAIDMYDAIIEEHPDEWRVRREKARVLGWDRRYAASLDEYDAILENDPDNRLVGMERDSKRAYFLHHDSAAISNYTQLIEEEPDNLEARFDLAQTYHRQSLYPEAIAGYDNVLHIYPGHFRAREARESARLESSAIEIAPRFDYLKRRSEDRLTDVKMYSAELELSRMLSDRLRGRASYGRERMSFTGEPSVSANVYGFGFDYKDSPYWDVSIGLGMRDYSGGIKSEYLYDASVGFELTDGLRGQVYSRRRAHLENYDTLTDNLYRVDVGATLHGLISENLQALAGYERGFLTDSNRVHEAFAEARYKLLTEPRSLWFNYKIGYASFDKSRPTYFTPSTFVNHFAGLTWRHELGDQEMFHGQRRTYYELGAGYGWDNRGQRGPTFSVGLHHDFSQRVSLGLNGSITRGSQYDEERLSMIMSFLW